MRFFEILIIIFLSINLIVFLLRSLPNAFNIVLLLFTIASGISHIIFEGLRWQLTLAYLLIFVFSLIHIFNLNKKSGIFKHGKTINSIFILCILGSIVFPIMLPVVQLPQPTGKYSIGSTYMLLTDSSRFETFEPQQNVYREIPIQIYYPTDKYSENHLTPYWENAFELSSAWTKGYGLGLLPFVWSHLGLVKSNYCKNTKISDNEKKYPVLIFSHGYWQFGKFNTTLIEELVSHGYIVLSITHTYETPLAVFPGNKIKTYSKNNPEFKKRTIEIQDTSSQAILEDIYYTKDSEKLKLLYQNWYDSIPLWIESNNIWVQDIIHCIEKLTRINQSVLENKIDTSQIGVLGFSFGGGASGLAAMKENRIKAGINIDGFQYGHNLEQYLTCPFMFVSSEDHKDANKLFYNSSESIVYDLVLHGAKHANFNDIALLAPIPGKFFGHLGTIDVNLGLRILKQYSVNFFNKHLKYIESDLIKDSNHINKNIDLNIYFNK